MIERISFPKLGGGVGHIELPPSAIHDRRNLERQLRDVGAALPRGKSKVAALLQQLAHKKARDVCGYAARCGWTRDGRAFVLPRSSIGTSAQSVIGVNPTLFELDGSGARSEVGTTLGWSAEVAKPAGQSSLLMCVISFAFAGPFLSILGRDSRTICLFGPSRSGKTTATLVAASAIGIGHAAALPTWNVTDAHLEQQLALFSDSLFPIDDLGIIGGKPRDAYRRIHDLAYRLHQGWARGRHSSFVRPAGIREQWRAIGITSSELAIRDLAEEAGAKRQAGECVRLIDVPVLIDGADNLFDRAQRSLDRRASADLLHDIVDSVQRHHGRVFRRHVSNMIKKGKKLKKFANRKIRDFTNLVIAQEDGNLTRDVAETFGLAYAAALFAIRCGLLPWSEAHLREALTKIYLGARELLPDDGVLLRRGIQALHTAFREIRQSAVQGVHKIDFETAIGICKIRRSRRQYLIKGDSFNCIFDSGREKDLVIGFLLKKGRMTAAGPAKSNRASTRKPKTQITWPDGRRRRSVEIVWPRKSDNRK